MIKLNHNEANLLNCLEINQQHSFDIVDELEVKLSKNNVSQVIQYISNCEGYTDNEKIFGYLFVGARLALESLEKPI